MASYDDGSRTSGRATALAVALLLLVVAGYVIAATTDTTSLDPDTGCYYGQVLTADGTCR